MSLTDIVAEVNKQARNELIAARLVVQAARKVLGSTHPTSENETKKDLRVAISEYDRVLKENDY